MYSLLQTSFNAHIYFSVFCEDSRYIINFPLLDVIRARLAQSVEHQTFKAVCASEKSEGQGFKSLIGRKCFCQKNLFYFSKFEARQLDF